MIVYMTGLNYFKGLEKSTRSILPASPWTMVRVDGASFSKYTKDLEKPYDADFTAAMTLTAWAMCQELQAPIAFAYVQSDEISVLFDNRTANGDFMPWYGGQVQKIVSMTAATATAHFNHARMEQGKFSRLACFDSRVFNFDTYADVEAYIAWRQRDSIKNTVSMAAHSIFSNKDLFGVNTEERKEMLNKVDSPWEALPSEFRFGRFIYPVKQLADVTYLDKRSNKKKSTRVHRTHWLVKPAVESVSTVYPEEQFGLKDKTIALMETNKTQPHIVVKTKVDIAQFTAIKASARNRKDVIDAAKR